MQHLCGVSHVSCQQIWFIDCELLVQMPKFTNAEKRYDMPSKNSWKKKISQSNGLKKTYICETRKLKQKSLRLISLFFLSFMYTLSRGCCHGPSCSFIIQSPNHNVIEKKKCAVYCLS